MSLCHLNNFKEALDSELYLVIMKHVNDIPNELLVKITRYFPKEIRCNFRRCCKRFQAAVDTSSVWKNRTVDLKNVRKYERKTWDKLRLRKLSSISLTPPNTQSQEILKLVLSELSSVRTVYAHCSVFHAFYHTPVKCKLSRVYVTMDSYHFASRNCKCTTMLKSLNSVKEIYLTMKIPPHETPSLEYFLEIHNSLPALREILIRYTGMPPPQLMKNFAQRLSTPNLLQIIPQLQKELEGKGVVKSEEMRLY